MWARASDASRHRRLRRSPPEAQPEAQPEAAPEAPAAPQARSALAIARSIRPHARPAPQPAAAPALPPGRADLIRYFDLREIAAYLTCQQIGAVLPLRADDPAYCGGRNVALDPVDPVTGLPYRYLRESDTAFSLCADFDDPGAIRLPSAPANGYDPAAGCMRVRLR